MASIINSKPFAPNTVFKDCSQGICSIYCPQWCYIIFSPPPSSSITLGDNDLDNDDNSSSFHFSPLIVAVIGILASIFILVTYYTIISRFCKNSYRTNNEVTNFNIEHHEDGVNNNELSQVSSSFGLDETLIKSITVCKYKKDSVLVDGIDCSVCLSEFQENESLRLLPKCNHAFHIPCIDPWLKSHSSCPLCRSNIDPTQRDGSSSILMDAPATMNMSINALEYQQRSEDVVIVIPSSESSIDHDVLSFDNDALPKWPVESATADDDDDDDGGGGENVRRVSVRDILNDNEHDVELQMEGSDIGSSRGVVNMVKIYASKGRSMFIRYGSK
ncbi:hypothetical protein TanjilG_10498 [Lupinus angustifolius]|uniref:RING-type E3 ubiquitin transferase n=1 Tax=Lupinus angustifolius TaxID=3871 RepID=A0A4P1R4E5_LUPAN|nr:PREDICTED: RING-H2 finger protein ATL52-like [Lupinus angustifolius]OIW01337.1 hypothetical protein TanjilG_10498 [Lupinus angustifolius]